MEVNIVSFKDFPYREIKNEFSVLWTHIKTWWGRLDKKEKESIIYFIIKSFLCAAVSIIAIFVIYFVFISVLSLAESWQKNQVVGLVNEFYRDLSFKNKRDLMRVTTTPFYRQLEIMDDFQLALLGDVPVNFSVEGILEPFLINRSEKKVFYTRIRKQIGNLSQIDCRLMIFEKIPNSFGETNWQLSSVESRSIECDSSVFKFLNQK